MFEAVLTSIHNLCFEQKHEKSDFFYLKKIHFLVIKFSVYLNRNVFVMYTQRQSTFLCYQCFVSFKYLWWVVFSDCLHFFCTHWILTKLIFPWANGVNFLIYCLCYFLSKIWGKIKLAEKWLGWPRKPDASGTSFLCSLFSRIIPFRICLSSIQLVWRP